MPTPEQLELERLISQIDFTTERYYNLYFEPPGQAELADPASEAWASLSSLTADLNKFRGEIARLRMGVEQLRLPAIEAVGLDKITDQLRGLEGSLKGLSKLADAQDGDEGPLKRLLKDMLNVLDAFDRVDELVDKQPGAVPEGVRKGLASVNQLLDDTLVKYGLKPLELGDEFNPHEQLAMGTEPCEGKPDGAISRVLLRGYTYRGQLLRTAQVVVVKNKAPRDAGGENGTNPAGGE